MVKKIYCIIGLVAALFMAGCSETLEETYDEYTCDGVIRYVGKCADVAVNPGWERLQVVWRNNVDPGIDSVKITWQAEGGQLYTRLIDRTNAVDTASLMDTIYLEGLQDALYTVRVSNLASDGSESLVEELYARPYTLTHEDLRTFTRGISAFSKMGDDRLMVMLDQYNENIDSMVLCYYGTDGQEYVWDMKKHMSDTLWGEEYGIQYPLGRDYMFLLPEEENVGIDFTRDVLIKRSGKLAGCIDPIDFEDEKLDMNERLWSTDFSQLMLDKYGSGWESKMENLEEIEIDYDFLSLQDLMYLPALKKVVLGKNRYMSPIYTNSYRSTTDEYVGLLALNFLHETHPGFTVERYGSHYFFGKGGLFGPETPYIELYKDAGKINKDFAITEKSSENVSLTEVTKEGEYGPTTWSVLQPKGGTYTPLDTTGWEVTCSDTLHNGYKDNGAAWLLYDTWKHVVEEMYGIIFDEYYTEVYFEPEQTLGASIVTVVFDMKKEQVVKGFKVAQPERNTEGDESFRLSSIMIEFSNDGYSYEPATNADGSATIGTAPGEQTFIEVPEELQKPYRYIRLSMSSQSVSAVSGMGIYNLRLGKFIPLAELNVQEP